MALVRRRMAGVPMKEHLKRHLLSVWLTALAYNPTLTIAYFERENLTTEFFTQVTQHEMLSSFVNIYERKTLIIGLTSALNAEVMPPAMASHLL